MALSSFKYQDEKQCVEELLSTLDWDQGCADRIADKTCNLITHARQHRTHSGEIEGFLRAYGLETPEGIALMTLAEALLRIPDSETASALIKDKINQADWSQSKSDDWMLKATSLGLNITKKTLNSLIETVGAPFIRQALRQAMKMMGRQFVLGRSIEEAMAQGKSFRADGYGLSYDMLGEGARTQKDADRYFEAYKNAVRALSESPQNNQTGISVKLSALHPRYEFAQKESCVPILTQRLLELCHLSIEKNMRLTVDAEEADRLSLSLEIVGTVMQDKKVRAWAQDTYGFGMAVQAYQKRAVPLIQYLVQHSQETQCPLHVRLVKGAYWDTEIKHAQIEGLPDYPVFTRKDHTDLSYLVCAQILLSHRDTIYPMFGTHNAQTIASILEFAGETQDDFEFQRLHGMGENLYKSLLKQQNVKVSLYAPVGKHNHLLAYLVRRLLENGANSSFVHKIYNEDIPVEDLAQDYVHPTQNHETKRHPHIPLPQDIYAPRLNSKGMDLHEETNVSTLLKMMNPLDLTPYLETSQNEIDEAFQTAKEGFKLWRRTLSIDRATCLLKLADLLEDHKERLISLCVYEAGKTIPDALAEIREAIDFCRYYAMRGITDFDEKRLNLPSPTGETNRLILEGRGVFVCVSPWNFPLAIFTGQVVAALMAGNAVIAKPAEQTPHIAMDTVALMHEAGIPDSVLQLVIGDGQVGAALVDHLDVGGVAFTGSTKVARSINRTLAAKEGTIVPLIAETGGQNAMIVDSSALTEQVVDDVILSAFGSAGQRCSALRLLCLQEDIADQTIEMLKGAMDELVIGDPSKISTDIGPVIDKEALHHLKACVQGLTPIKTLFIDKNLEGHFFAPALFEITDISELKEEIFGPVLHVYRFQASQRETVIEEINALGFGLTFGVHSRIETHIQKDVQAIQAGNIYINRSTIGAVVGVQPFGGRGLSGTGPKAGGPHYLPRFATEKTITTNTTASGGNTALLSL